MKKTARVWIGTLALAATLASGVASAAEAQWQPVDKGEARTDISTFERGVDGSDVKAFRGVTEVQAPIVSVMAVMADASACEQWLYQCKAMELRDNHRAYFRFKGIWPAKDRDALVQTKVTQDKSSKAVTLASHAVEGEPEHEDVVRVAALRDQFVLTPLDDGWTRIEFQTFIDPGGNVTGIANTISKNAPKETLQGLRKLATAAPYKDATLDDAMVRYDSVKEMDFPQSHQR
ncbi:START domain-containing protein [Alloalcanivorax mobilis]|uniref:START domain-containing protein n=1 Tax=Alloalcanivorax mobilis TaxID=2019569 RepID=UPI000B5B0DF3|nr:START domain-containing protein [Alloalcanivorax mobilis]ASK35329.1 hypothetical protein CEK62_13535 [Alcanivorax sp. N3-2A]